MEIAIDFDGTVVMHEYPKVGATLHKCVDVLKELVANKHNLILFTMRHEQQLQDAIDWFKANGIPLYGVQYNPTQCDWTKSNKCYAQLYIDDAALGCPLSVNCVMNGEKLEQVGRPFVDWEKVREMLVLKDLISED